MDCWQSPRALLVDLWHCSVGLAHQLEYPQLYFPVSSFRISSTVHSLYGKRQFFPWGELSEKGCENILNVDKKDTQIELRYQTRDVEILSPHQNRKGFSFRKRKRFITSEGASVVNDLLATWNPKYFGIGTTVRRPKTDIFKLVVRDFDVEIDDADATKELKTEFPDGVFKCFLRRDKTRLTTAVISFNDETSYTKALKEGIFIENQHYRTFPFIEKPRIIRCYNCQRFGHSANLCNKERTCSRYGSKGHSSDVCEESNEIKCANYNKGHVSYSTACSVYRATLAKLYTLKNIEIPIWLSESNHHG